MALKLRWPKVTMLSAAFAHLQRGVRPALTQNGHIGAGNHTPLGIDYAEAAVRNIPQLNNDTLKNAVGHIYSHSLVSCINAHFTKTHYYYTQLLRTLQVPFDILLQNALFYVFLTILSIYPRFTGKRSLRSLVSSSKMLRSGLGFLLQLRQSPASVSSRLRLVGRSPRVERRPPACVRR